MLSITMFYLGHAVQWRPSTHAGGSDSWADILSARSIHMNAEITSPERSGAPA